LLLNTGDAEAAYLADSSVCNHIEKISKSQVYIVKSDRYPTNKAMKEQTL
jgi:hypothetical protein